MEKRKSFLAGCILWLAAVILVPVLVAAPENVQAARVVSYKARVNGNYSAKMVKKGKYWYLQPGMKTPKAPLRGLQYIKISKRSGLSSGYYMFRTNGRLDTRRMFHTVNKRVNGQKFKGEYYFGYKNGRLYTKGGWTVIKGEKYYLSRNGRMYKSCWRSGYYLKKNGRIAKSMKLPDGSYVDYNGRKCTKQEYRLNRLKKSLESMMNGYRGDWSVYVKDLKTGATLSLNDKAMYPASVIKLFVMASTYDRIQKGSMQKTAYVDSLLRSMITVSDNESFNELVRLHSGDRSFVNGCRTVNNYLKKAGFTKTACHFTLHPSRSAICGDGGRNQGSAREAGILLEKIYNGKCVSKRYSREMKNLLLNQTRRGKIPAGLPSGVKVANKTGETSDYQHDTAIVYGPETDYIVCIFAATDEYNGVNGIRALSSKIYNFLN